MPKDLIWADDIDDPVDRYAHLNPDEYRDLWEQHWDQPMQEYISKSRRKQYVDNPCVEIKWRDILDCHTFHVDAITQTRRTAGGYYETVVTRHVESTRPKLTFENVEARIEESNLLGYEFSDEQTDMLLLAIKEYHRRDIHHGLLGFMSKKQAVKCLFDFKWNDDVMKDQMKKRREDPGWDGIDGHTIINSIIRKLVQL